MLYPCRCRGSGAPAGSVSFEKGSGHSLNVERRLHILYLAGIDEKPLVKIRDTVVITVSRWV
jgi:hypothetical protein